MNSKIKNVEEQLHKNIANINKIVNKARANYGALAQDHLKQTIQKPVETIENQ